MLVMKFSYCAGTFTPKISEDAAEIIIDAKRRSGD